MEPEGSGVVMDYEPAVSRLAARLKMAEADLVARMRRLVDRVKSP